MEPDDRGLATRAPQQTSRCSDSTSYDLLVEVCSRLTNPAFAAVSVGPKPFGEQLVLRTGTKALDHRLLSVDGRPPFADMTINKALKTEAP